MAEPPLSRLDILGALRIVSAITIFCAALMLLYALLGWLSARNALPIAGGLGLVAGLARRAERRLADPREKRP